MKGLVLYEEKVVSVPPNDRGMVMTVLQVILSGVRKRTNFTDPFGLRLGPLILTREMYKT